MIPLPGASSRAPLGPGDEPPGRADRGSGGDAFAVLLAELDARPAAEGAPERPRPSLTRTIAAGGALPDTQARAEEAPLPASLPDAERGADAVELDALLARSVRVSVPGPAAPPSGARRPAGETLAASRAGPAAPERPAEEPTVPASPSRSAAAPFASARRSLARAGAERLPQADVAMPVRGEGDSDPVHPPAAAPATPRARLSAAAHLPAGTRAPAPEGRRMLGPPPPADARCASEPARTSAAEGAPPHEPEAIPETGSDVTPPPCCALPVAMMAAPGPVAASVSAEGPAEPDRPAAPFSGASAPAETMAEDVPPAAKVVLCETHFAPVIDRAPGGPSIPSPRAAPVALAPVPADAASRPPVETSPILEGRAEPRMGGREAVRPEAREAPPAEAEPAPATAPAPAMPAAAPPLPGAALSPAVQLGAAVAEAARAQAAPALAGGEAVPARGPVRVLEIQLRPLELGLVTVRLRTGRNGLEIHVHAARTETARLLEQDRAGLLGVLADAEAGPLDLTISQTGLPARLTGDDAFAPAEWERRSGEENRERNRDDSDPRRRRQQNEEAASGAADGGAAGQHP